MKCQNNVTTFHRRVFHREQIHQQNSSRIWFQFFYVSHVLWVFVVELDWINSIGVVLLVETSVAVRQCIESVNFRFVFKNWNVFVNINSIKIAFYRKKLILHLQPTCYILIAPFCIKLLCFLSLMVFVIVTTGWIHVWVSLISNF